ncbi:unnamed protein product [Linum trigynum]|uniref:Uncharacterized protein n=1 Tax=Linum trigynum TaxID=586398 RepID=A0AAV2EPP4_9ROSI
MASIARASPPSSIINVHRRALKLLKPPSTCQVGSFPRYRLSNRSGIRCTKSTPWEPSPPVTYALGAGDESNDFLNKPANLFETLSSDGTAEEPSTKSEEQLAQTKTQQEGPKFQFLKWPLWFLGPALLLVTGMVPTLWLPLSSVFLGPNIASLLALIGLDSIYNLGVTLYLLMADSCARSGILPQACNSQPPLAYKFWNMVSAVAGFAIPLVMLGWSQKGLLQPQLPVFSFAILMGPYLLLLSVQFLTELLTWNWQSPVWLVTPVVYETYRVLQLMRGLKLATELNSPVWMLDTIRWLVSCWILILGIQLMSVAWFAGYSARTTQQQKQ